MINKKQKSFFYIFPILLLTISFLKGGLVSPENGASLNHIHVTFEWEQIPEANHYEVQIAESANFSTPIVQVDDNTLVYIEKDALDWDKTYHWRIRPVNNYGVSGPWTDSYSFSTGSPLSETTTIVSNATQIQEGVTVFGAFFNYFSAAVDQTGKEIWNSGSENIVYYSTSKYGDVFGCTHVSGAENNLPGMEFTFDGNTIWEEPNEEFLHHDMIQLPNGNYLGIVEIDSLGPIPIGEWTPLFQSLGFMADGITIEFPWIGDKLIEWDKETKDVVWSWNVFDHFNMVDYDQVGGTWYAAYQSLHYDWTHVNAVIFDEEVSAIYISTRHLSRITKIDYPSGDVIWNLGHQMASGDVDMGTDIGFSFQHSLQILNNGNMLTFDNGNLAPEFRGTDEPISRTVEVSVVESGNNFSAELYWSYDLPEDLFGFASGNTQKLDNGNVLVTTIGGGGTSLEVNPDGEVVWEANYNLTLPYGAVYRAHRIPGLFPTAFSIIIENYHASEEETGVYLPTGNSDIAFTLTHEGSFGQSFSFELEDQMNWFNQPSGNVSLEPGESTSLIFTGNVSAIDGGNTITLTVVPDHHPEKIKIINVNGYTNPLDVGDQMIPSGFELKQPFPNPFNSSISIQFSVGDANFRPIKLEIMDLAGRGIETLVDGNFATGSHEVKWNADAHPSGLYFVKLAMGEQIVTKKILYLK